jgi:hypothetical protein
MLKVICVEEKVVPLLRWLHSGFSAKDADSLPDDVM